LDLLAAGRMFVRVVECGSFSTVAKQQGLNASSVSRQINQLEQHLSARLIQRSTRQLRITESGEVFYQRIKTIINEVEDLESTLRDLSAEPKGLIKVSATIGFGEQVLSVWVSEFLKRYPEIRVELSLSDKISGLIESDVDVAIRLTDPKDSSLIAQKLAGNEFYLCASASYIKQSSKLECIEQVAEHNCLLYQQDSVLQRWDYYKYLQPSNSIARATHNDRQLLDGGLSVSGNFITSSPQSLLKAGLQGLGLVLLTRWSAQEHIRLGDLIRVFPEYRIAPAGLLHTGIYALYPNREFFPLKSKVFVEFLKEKISSYQPADK